MADQTTTVPITRLSENYKPFTHISRIQASNINTSTWTTEGDTISVEHTNLDLPDNFVVGAVLPYVKTAFATSGTLTAQVGTDGDPNNFVTDTTVKTAGPIVTQAGMVPATLAGSFGASGDDLMVRFSTESGSGSPSSITAGDLRILWQVIDVDDLVKGY